MVEDKAFEQAKAIVQRYHLKNRVLPKLLTKRDNPEKEQEFKDAQKLKNWKKFLKVRDQQGDCCLILL